MNLCCFSGRITRDAETKIIRDDMSITSFSIAVDTGFGERKRTEFINVKAFKKDALAPYLTKGKPVLVAGEYQEEKWEKDGQKHSRVVILARDIEFQQGDRGQQQAAPQVSKHPQYNADEDLGPAFPSEPGGMDECPF